MQHCLAHCSSVCCFATHRGHELGQHNNRWHPALPDWFLERSWYVCFCHTFLRPFCIVILLTTTNVYAFQKFFGLNKTPSKEPSPWRLPVVHPCVSKKTIVCVLSCLMISHSYLFRTTTNSRSVVDRLALSGRIVAGWTEQSDEIA